MTAKKHTLTNPGTSKASGNCLCDSCGYCDDIWTYKPCYGFNDCRCPACGSTNNEHNRVYMERMYSGPTSPIDKSSTPVVIETVRKTVRKIDHGSESNKIDVMGLLEKANLKIQQLEEKVRLLEDREAERKMFGGSGGHDGTIGMRNEIL